MLGSVIFKFVKTYLPICACAILVCVVVGCSGKPTAGHTHLWIGDKAFNVWSYLRVETFKHAGEETEIAGFMSQQLEAGDQVKLTNGSVVSYDGSKLTIDKVPVMVANVQLEANGKVRENAFIKAK